MNDKRLEDKFYSLIKELNNNKFESKHKDNARKYVYDLLRNFNVVDSNIVEDVECIQNIIDRLNDFRKNTYIDDIFINELFNIVINVLEILNRVTIVSSISVMDDGWLNILKGVAEKLDISDDELRLIIEDIYKKEKDDNV